MNQEDIKTMMKKYHEVTGNTLDDETKDLELRSWVAAWGGGMEAERAACVSICTVWQQTESESDAVDIIKAEIQDRGEIL